MCKRVNSKRSLGQLGEGVGIPLLNVTTHDVERIKEIYPIVYGNNEVPRSKLIRKDFGRGIVVEAVKGQKISWAEFGHEINTN
jgi:hypothetical protein